MIAPPSQNENTAAVKPGIRPLRDTVIVEFQMQDAMQRGIALPETARQVSNEGKVVAVGPGRWERGERIPMEVQVGDRVLFRRWDASALIYEGQAVLSMPEGNILCVVDEQSAVSFEGTVVK